MREAAVSLIIKDGLILGISRRDDFTKFGLIGGKLEKGESPIDAAIRETKEECGINIISAIQIYKRVEPAGMPDGEEFYTYCFYADKWNGEPVSLNEGIVKWLTEKELTTTMAAFADYNFNTIKRFKELFSEVYIKYE